MRSLERLYRLESGATTLQNACLTDFVGAVFLLYSPITSRKQSYCSTLCMRCRHYFCAENDKL